MISIMWLGPEWLTPKPLRSVRRGNFRSVDERIIQNKAFMGRHGKYLVAWNRVGYLFIGSNIREIDFKYLQKIKINERLLKPVNIYREYDEPTWLTDAPLWLCQRVTGLSCEDAAVLREELTSDPSSLDSGGGEEPDETPNVCGTFYITLTDNSTIEFLDASQSVAQVHSATTTHAAPNFSAAAVASCVEMQNNCTISLTMADSTIASIQTV